MSKAPKKYPCGSCPYRRDVPSGVWAAEEYLKLIPFDRPTGEQPQAVFECHQQNGHLCSGWVGCHDMDENFALRISVAYGFTSGEDAEVARAYVSPVPLFESGMEAAVHGLKGIHDPDAKAQRVMGKIKKKHATTPSEES